MTDIVADKEHAKRSPSGAKKRALCPGSVVLEADREDRPSRYAAEGTVAHAVMELCLTEGKDAEAYVGRIMEADGFSFTVDMEMADAVNEFCNWAYSYVDTSAGDILLVEQQVPIGHISGEEGATGTADVVGITEGGTRLVVLDLKYGRGVPVYCGDAEDVNLQLAYYGNGALEDAELLGYEIANVTLGIGQPRLNNFDAVELTVDELRAVADKLRHVEAICNKAEDANRFGVELDGFLNPGEDACRFCKAKAVCPALLSEVAEAVSFGFVSADEFEQLDLTDSVNDRPLGGNMLSIAMAKVGMIEDWCLSVRAECEAELFAGRPVAGYKLVQGKKGNRAWNDEAGAALVLKKSRLPVDTLYTRKLVSPTAAEKLLKEKPKIWSQLSGLISQSDGKPSVAPESDKRPALDINASLTDFEDLDASGNDLI